MAIPNGDFLLAFSKHRQFLPQRNKQISSMASDCEFGLSSSKYFPNIY